MKLSNYLTKSRSNHKFPTTFTFRFLFVFIPRTLVNNSVVRPSSICNHVLEEEAEAVIWSVIAANLRRTGKADEQFPLGTKNRREQNENNVPNCEFPSSCLASSPFCRDNKNHLKLSLVFDFSANSQRFSGSGKVFSRWWWRCWWTNFSVVFCPRNCSCCVARVAVFHSLDGGGAFAELIGKWFNYTTPTRRRTNTLSLCGWISTWLTFNFTFQSPQR